MNSAIVYIPALLEKLQEMTADQKSFIRITFCEESVDELRYFPGFLHFEAIGKDGLSTDYESIDSVSPPNLDLLRALKVRRDRLAV
ncbi:hypothetical protein [Papillibacter cinnamivorans]|uniref:Uncharacterized protein n=1 Tax=Papillibacter cinnamivorans DSM 12816 TaxID=1122930 RepID=A0A1W2AHD9_9FIRM|nr:hypothetical protein [Papillibacter cinnamivorans]SMC59871.1 hypothetical protein SAMN02745168_1713 [Papillibacter cinnamivorans DSM 12816]